MAKKQSQKKTEIKAMVGEIKIDGNDFKTPIEVRVKRGVNVVPGLKVRFKKGIKEIYTANTNGNGELIYEHVEPLKSAGQEVEIRVFLEGLDAAETMAKFVLDEKTQVKKEKSDVSEYVKLAEIKAIGSDGKYCINIQAINELGFGNKCSVILTDGNRDLSRILPYKKASPPIETWSKFQIRVKTSDKGFVSVYLKNFTDPVRRIQVRIKGTTVDREVILKGPRKKAGYRGGAGFMKNLTQNF